MGKALKVCGRPDIGIELIESANIVAMFALRTGPEERRGVTIGDAEVAQIPEDAGGLSERELVVELETISGD
jgi:hypothetical protein